MSQYPQYRPSSIGLVTQVPSHWGENTIKRGFEVTLGKMLQGDRKLDGDLLAPYLRSANVQWGKVDVSDVQEMWFSPDETRQLTLEPGDLVACEGGDAGRAAIWQGEIADCYFQNSVNRVRSSGGHSTHFLMYWLSALKAGGLVDIICNKATIAHLTKEKLANLPMVYPPLDEQYAIAAYLDAETKRIDDLIKAKEQLVEKVIEMKVVAGFELATKGLHKDVQLKSSGIEWIDGVPSHWKVKRNMFLFRERNESGIDGLPILKVSLHTGVTEGDEDEDQGAARLRKQMDDKSAYKLTRKGDVAYNMMRAWQGAIGAVPVDGLVSPAYVVLKSDELDPEYFELLARTPFYKKDFERYSYGIASFRWRLYWEGFKEIKTPVPPLKEQQLIVAEYRKIAASIDDLKKHVEGEIELLQTLRESTITDAVLGRIDVRKAQAH